MICATCRQSDDDEDEEYDARLIPPIDGRVFIRRPAVVHPPSQGKNVVSNYHMMVGRALIKDIEKDLLGSDSGRLQLKGVAWIDTSTPVHVEKCAIGYHVKATDKAVLVHLIGLIHTLLLIVLFED